METELSAMMQLSEQAQIPPTAVLKPDGKSWHPATQRLRVLHFFTHLTLGGMELTALRMISHLDSHLFENQLCGIRGYDPELIALRCPQAGIVSLQEGKQASRTQILSMRMIIRKFRPHIVHSRNWGAIEAVPAARLAGVPVVIHSEHGYEMDSLAGLPLRRRLFRRAVYGMASAVFAVTDELRHFHAGQAWVSPSRIRVISNGIDTSLFSPRPQLRGSTLQKAGVPPTRFVVGSVGRLVPIKDHGTLLKAAEVLVQRGVDVHVILVGAGPELARHQQFLANSVPLKNRVSFLGASDNVSELLNAMDVFVLPSFSEGMSNTLIEAMSCGLPVLATRVGGNPEVVGEELSGDLFVPGDSNGLADKLERLARNAEMRRSLGKVAHQRAVSMFSLDGMIGNYQGLYLELAEKHGLLKRMSN
jgi:sugar transferase (PEP-CTERM/EpsH1 system associated)